MALVQRREAQLGSGKKWKKGFVVKEGCLSFALVRGSVARGSMLGKFLEAQIHLILVILIQVLF